MRALFQKLRASTSSKGTTTGYTPSSKELEKEKNFRPLPEWPPSSLNQNSKEQPKSVAVPASNAAAAISISLEPANSSVRTPSQAVTVNRPSQAIILDSELPPLPSFAEPLDLRIDDKTRKRASNGNSVSTFTVAPKMVPKEHSVATPPPGANASTSNAVSRPNGKTSPINQQGNTVAERRKASQSDAAAPKTTVTKQAGLHESRGSTSTNQTVGTFRTIPTGTVKNVSTRALVTSPQPGIVSAAHAHAVPAHLHHDHPHQPHGKYNAMGLPMADNVSLMRAGTPMSHMSERTGILTTASWSEAAEEDLVSNIGQRERTRQEVLWEIVASEQRYVFELMKMKESFIDPLLHPFAVNPLAAQSDEDYYREDTPTQSVDHLPIASRFLGPSSLRSATPGTPNTITTTHRTNATTPMIPTPDQDSDSERDDYDEAGPNAGKLVGTSKAGNKKTSFALSAAAKANHPRSPYGTQSRASGATAATNANPRLARMMPQLSSRSHHSLPPPPRGTGPTGATSTTSLGRKSANEDKEREREHRPATTEPTSHDRRVTSRHAHFAPSPPPGRVLKKTRKGSEDQPKLVVFQGGVPPHVLPEDFRKCLEVIENGILIGHLKLSEALRKRYDEQYPLVRSLADVFVGNSEILHEYATYVLHLERALEQVDNALNGPTVVNPKQPDSSDKVKITKLLHYLERRAALQGETGVAISLSKPFQRLLKYPLLFQNLLFHTDPSTFEYESTLQMVSEVETIVRSIEDEKIQKEERDKTRDAIARIDGLEKEKVLAVFKPSRLIISERPQEGSFADPNAKSTPPVAGTNRDRTVKTKSSFRRISEGVLGAREDKNGLGSKRDLWEVVFNDVVLLCQRTGTTTLPLSTTMNTRANSLPDTQGKAKHATTGKRVSSQVRPRNLYRFLRIESWTINERPKPRELVSKEAIERWRNQQASGHLMGSGDEPEEDLGGIESDDSDRKSKMSFSYWGADKVTITKPMSKRGQSTNASRVTLRTKPQAPSAFAGRQSEKDAKFGTRLRSPEPSQDGSVVGSARPGSRRMGGPPASPTMTRRNIDSKITNGSMTSVVSSKPGWDTSTRAAVTSAAGSVGAAGGQPAKRVRNISVTSGPPRVGNAKTLSAVPSEDSGVGMYRQIIAHDPSISSTKS